VSDQAMGDLLYFDAFTQVGPRLDKHPAEAWRLDELLAEMSHCSISAALVASTQSIHYDAMYGERRFRIKERGR
jgi:hypothetical protein